MPTITTNLLTEKEQVDIYALPQFNAKERTEYFTLNDNEISELRSFEDITEALYFCISLVFFKLKHTLVYFTYRQTTEERRHLIQRYFPGRSIPLSLPQSPRAVVRIENKVLALCGYRRCQTNTRRQLERKLLTIAPRYPKQRALCKKLLDLCIQEHIEIPKLTTLQTIVSDMWGQEQQRLRKLYKRYSLAPQRNQVLSLLEKNEKTHTIIDIRQEMKQFTMTEITKALAQHKIISPIFNLAKTVLPKLKLPSNTVRYYADLVDPRPGF